LYNPFVAFVLITDSNVVGPQHHWCLPSAPHVRGVRTICAEPQHQTLKAQLSSPNIRISSPTNTQQLSPTITFHHQPTPIIQHPTLNTQHKSLWVFQTFSTFAG